MQLTEAEHLAYSTVQISCIYRNGNEGSGTGFLFKYSHANNKTSLALITNKHVIEDAQRGNLILTKSDANGLPIDRDHFTITFDDFELLWKSHPETDVDLCAMSFDEVLKKVELSGINLFYTFLDIGFIPNEEVRVSLDQIEEIVMVGYPDGIWDNVNNKPIFRRGLTATHPCFDYEGRKEFMIDAACFPGSSGSPVLLYNLNGYKTKNEWNLSGTRVFLLGVLYAGPQHEAEGTVEFVPIARSYKERIVTQIPNNLGLVIKSERILELQSLFFI